MTGQATLRSGPMAELEASSGRKGRFPEALAERVLASHPAPVADALFALLGAESPFEVRDRIVEVFRAELRLIAALTLAARLQYGPGPRGAPADVADLLRALRGRGLTDGQWVALVRELLRPWAAAPDAHPLAVVVRLVHARKSELLKLWDELLVMRKSETVAHGASGTRKDAEAIIEKRMPQLARSLELVDPLWSSLRIVLPKESEGSNGGPRRAAVLMGVTSGTGRFRSIDVDLDAAIPHGEPLLVDERGLPKLSLHPVVLVRRATASSAEELFFLDGSTRRGALYVAFPSMAEHGEAAAWSSLDAILDEDGSSSTDAPAPSARPERPYRGLSSFGPDDTSLFFGREDQAEELANLIRRHGFVTVTGQSGSGKTSLLRAGALPLLRDAIVAFVRPGAHPLASLASRLAEAMEIDRGEIELLLTHPVRLRDRLESSARGRAVLVVVVVDQAEELLTLAASPEERGAFARALVALAHAEGSTRVVLSLREDFFGRVATVTELAGVFSQHVEIVTTPDRAACIRILVGPAKAFGYTFEDEELVGHLVDAVEGASAALALLSFTADRLWEARDRKWKRLRQEASTPSRWRRAAGSRSRRGRGCRRSLSRTASSRSCTTAFTPPWWTWRAAPCCSTSEPPTPTSWSGSWATA